MCSFIIYNKMPSSCQETKSYIPLAVNVALHVLILFTILSLFFMFYISKVETNAFATEIKGNIEKAIDGISGQMSFKDKQVLSAGLNNQYVQKYKKRLQQQTRYVTVYNDWLFKSMYISMAGIAIIVVIVLLLLMYQCDQCIPLKDILIENGLTFFFVGIIEFLFFTKVALNFVPTKPSLLVNTFFDDINVKLGNTI